MTGGAVKLVWELPIETGGSSLLGQVVEASSDSIQWTTVGRVHPDAQQVVIGRLDASTPYFFRVAAVGSLGTGPPSQRSLRIDTMSVSPPGPAKVPEAAIDFERDCAGPHVVIGSGTVPCPPRNDSSHSHDTTNSLRAVVVGGDVDADVLPAWIRASLASTTPSDDSSLPVLASGSRPGPSIALEVMAPVDDGGAMPGGVAVVLAGAPTTVPIAGLDPMQCAALSRAALKVASIVSGGKQAALARTLSPFFDAHEG